MITAAFVVVASLAAPADVFAPLERTPTCASLAKSGRLAEAERCYRDVGNTDAAAVVAAYAQSAPNPDSTTAKVDQPGIDFSALVADGRAEGMVHGTAAGATAGFLTAATIFATTRASKNDSLPWLIATPVVGALAGAGGSYALLTATKPTPGTIALASSTMWAGATEGFLLQLAVFDKSSDVTSAPLRFATILGGGALGLGSGVLLSTSIAPTSGDVAVANSAFLWGGVLTAFGLGFASANNAQLTTPEVSFALLGGTLLPYALALGAYPLLDIERGPSWLIEGGGAGGFLVASAFVVIAGSGIGANTGNTAAFEIAVLGAGTAAGVALGATAAVIVSAGVHETEARDAAKSAGLDVHAAPSALLDVKGNAAPGLAVSGSF